MTAPTPGTPAFACPHCHYAGCSPNCPAPIWLTSGEELAERFGLPYVLGASLAQSISGALAAARAAGRAERSEGFRRMLSAAGISDHEGGGGDTYYDRPAAHMLEELIAERDALRDELDGARADLAYMRNQPPPVSDETAEEALGESVEIVAELRAEMASAQQTLNAALDGEEVSRGDLTYDVDTLVDQRDEARQEIVRLAQARTERKL